MSIKTILCRIKIMNIAMILNKSKDKFLLID